MTVLGARAAKSQVDWVLLAGTKANPALAEKGKLRRPRNYEAPEWLSWMRQQMVQLIREQTPSALAIVGIEGNARARRALFPRVQVEAVLLEVGHSLGLDVSLLTWPSIASALSTSKSKSAYARADDFRGISTDELSNEQTESLHAAASLLP